MASIRLCRASSYPDAALGFSLSPLAMLVVFVVVLSSLLTARRNHTWAYGG